MSCFKCGAKKNNIFYHLELCDCCSKYYQIEIISKFHKKNLSDLSKTDLIQEIRNLQECIKKLTKSNF